MSIRPKKGRVALSILGVYTHQTANVQRVTATSVVTATCMLHLTALYTIYMTSKPGDEVACPYKSRWRASPTI